jgi:hypothetical protein
MEYAVQAFHALPARFLCFFHPGLRGNYDLLPSPIFTLNNSNSNLASDIFGICIFDKSGGGI